MNINRERLKAVWETIDEVHDDECACCKLAEHKDLFAETITHLMLLVAMGGLNPETSMGYILGLGFRLGIMYQESIQMEEKFNASIS